MKQGEAPQALIAALKDEEARRLSLQAELDRLASLRQSSSLDLKRIEKTIRKRVEDVQGVLGRHIPESRRILKTLLVGRMEFTPIIEADVRGYAFKGRASLGGLLVGAAHIKEVGSPNGITHTVVSRITVKVYGISLAA